MILKQYFILILLILLSCSGPVVTDSQDEDLNVVELDSHESKKSGAFIKNESDVMGVGPSMPSGPGQIVSNKSEKIVWGLFLSAGLNRVICHAVAVKALSERAIDFNVYSGFGMGAIVAAYLADGITPEVIEWRFHKFFQKTKGMRPFDSDWIERVESELLKDFKGKKIQTLKKTLIIPVFNQTERKLVFFRRGDLYEKLLENLLLDKNKKYLSPLTYGTLELANIKKMGVQKLVGINVLGKKVLFNKNEDYLFGLYAKVSSQYSKLNDQIFDYQLDIPVNDFSMDSIDNLPGHLRDSYLFTKNNIKLLEEDYFKTRDKN